MSYGEKGKTAWECFWDGENGLGYNSSIGRTELISFLGRNFTFCLDLMNKMLWYLINLRWNLIKYIQFDGFISDVMFYFYLAASHGWYNRFDKF